MTEDISNTKNEMLFDDNHNWPVIRIWNCLFIISILVTFVTILHNELYSVVPNLAVLPFSYSISLLISKKMFRKQFGLALIIIEIVMLCRFIAIPLFYAFSKRYEGVLIFGSNCIMAVWLMSYEEIIVGIVMCFIASIKHKDIPLHRNDKHEQKMIRPVTIFLGIFWLFIIINNAKLRGQLLNFSLLTREQMGLAYNTTPQEYNADIPGIYSVFFKIGLIVVFAIVIQLISKLKLHSITKAIGVLVASVAFVSSMWTNGFSVSRWGMMVATIISVYTLIYIFPQKKKKIIIIGICALAFVILFGSLLKIISFGKTNATLNDATNKYLSIQYFDEYFEGIGPVANGIETAQIYGEERGAEGILIDTCYNFPYAMRILGLSDAKVATDYFHLATGHYDLIMPTITQGYMQFGLVFSPLYSIICVTMAFWMNRKLTSSKSFYKRLFYIILVFWFSLFMAVSTNVIEANIWYAVIAVWLLSIEEKYNYVAYDNMRL